MQTRIPHWVVVIVLVLFALWILAQAEGVASGPYVPTVPREHIQRRFP